MSLKTDEVASNVEPFEKKPTQSKKFVAFLISEFLWKAIILVMICMLFWVEFSAMYGSVMIVVVVAAVFIETGFILGQASLDKLVRMAQVTGQALPLGKLKQKGEEVLEDVSDKAKEEASDVLDAVKDKAASILKKEEDEDKEEIDNFDEEEDEDF